MTRYLFLLLALPLAAWGQTAIDIRAGSTGANDGSDWNNAYTSMPSPVRGRVYMVADGTYSVLGDSSARRDGG